MAATLALGCMNFGRRTPEPEARRVIDRALEAGLTWLDTANVYGDGESERIVGRAIRGRRDAVRIGSKVGAGRVDGRPEGSSGARVVAACDESLTRLGVDRLDLLSLHVPDLSVAVDDTLAGIGQLLERGRIVAWGVSNHASWQVLELATAAARLGLPPPADAQQLYNTLVRQLDVEWFAYARRHPIETTVYNPLAGGLLVGAHDPARPPPKASRFGNPMYRRRYWRASAFRAVDALRAIADADGRSLVALAYGAVLNHPGIDRVLVGPASVAHLDAALEARGAPWPEALDRAVREVYFELVGTDATYAR